MKVLVSFMCMFCFVLSLHAQQKTVTGTVRDETNEAIPFVTVTETGTNNAVQANEKGAFSIKIAEGSGLTFSATGYQQQSIAVTGTSFNIVLIQSEGKLQEVVITTLGGKRTRNQLAYSAQQVNGEDVSKMRTSNFIQNLSGKIAGLELRQTNTLGGSTNVILRGAKSLTGSNQALFVIDGVPVDNYNARSLSPTTGLANQAVGSGGYDYGNAAADINPDDIETITVLKGGASTALYGSRGGNGVILITTKKGKKGLGVTINTGVTVGNYDKSTFPKYQNEYGQGYDPSSYQDPSGGFAYRDVNGDGIMDLVAVTTADASYGARFNPNLMVYQWDAFDTASANYLKARPWVAAANGPETFFESAISTNFSVAIDGGSDRGTFKLAYTRNDDKGILPNSKISKNLVNFGSTFNLTSNLTAGATIGFTNVQGKGRYGTGYDGNNGRNLMTNFRQWWGTNVDVQEQKTAYFRHHKNVTWNWRQNGANTTPIFWDNAYWIRHQNFETDGRNRIIGNVNLNFAPVDWLNILGRVSTDFYSEQQDDRVAVGSKAVASYTRTNHNFREINYDLIVNLEKDLSKTVNLKALLGTNIRDGRDEFIVATTNGGLIIPGIFALSNTRNALNAPYEMDERKQVWGNFTGGTLTWKEMLTFDATVRNDQSSTLPKGNNSYWYPSASLGFNFSKLLDGMDWLSYGKLRANYAQVGNDTRPYRTTEVYRIQTPYGSNPVITVPDISANTELEPEKTKSFEFGIEASFLKNRVGFDITYYDAQTFNQVVPAPVSTATGNNSKYLNAGSVRNKGIEVSAYGSPVQTKNFSWALNLNWSANKSMVEELAPGVNNLLLASFATAGTINAPVGQPYGILRGSDFIYTNGQRTVGANGQYLVTASANHDIGQVFPDWIAGINNSVRYKKISLGFLIDVKKGGDVYSADMAFGLAGGLYPETAGLNDLGNPSRNTLADGGGIILPGVTEDGKTNTIRISNFESGSAYGFDHQPDKAFVYDASYVKLREVILNYSLPAGLVNKVKIFKSIDLSLIGRNLWIIHKKLPYADPEEGLSSGNFQGYQVGAYPSVKTMALNIKFKF